MTFRFASLGSGSKGNGTLVEGDDTCILIDCGFSVRETERRLARLGKTPDDLQGILVTHEHSDHTKGVRSLARKYKLPVVMTHGTARAAFVEELALQQLISPHRAFVLGKLHIMPVAVPHDACEPVQYTISHDHKKIGVLTDLGRITRNVAECFGDCDGLLLEANHDSAMLSSGVYPGYLKRRVGGEWGHLNNHQSAELLASADIGKIQSLVLGHISLQNNQPERVADAVSAYTKGVGKVLYACQEEGFPWQVIE